MITLNTFGSFQLQQDGRTINNTSMNSNMLTKLLIYLIIRRYDDVTKPEIAANLWEDGESDDPMGALKNLTYRLRKELARQLGGDNYIITSRGKLKWNDELDIIVDVDEFMLAYEKGRNEKEPFMSRIENLEKCILLYNGDFMSEISDAHWALNQLLYYKSCFVDAAVILSELYISKEMYSDLENICTKVLDIYSADERIYYYLILAQTRSGKTKLAMESYKNAAARLKSELGITNSAELSKVYRELLNADGDEQQPKDIYYAREDMVEEDPNGVFKCGYQVFRIIYQLEQRRNERLQIPEYVLMLSLVPEGYESGSYTSMQNAMIRNAMPKMEDIIVHSLRAGDVVARYSESQFIILLPNCDYNSAMIVANRLSGEFYQKSRNIRVDFTLSEVTSNKN